MSAPRLLERTIGLLSDRPSLGVLTVAVVGAAVSAVVLVPLCALRVLRVADEDDLDEPHLHLIRKDCRP